MDILTRVIIHVLVQSESHVLRWDRIQTSDDLGRISKLCVFQVSRGKHEKNAALCEAAKGSAPFPRVPSSHPGAQMDA